METKDSDLQILKQFRGFMNSKLMIDQLPESSISAFEIESVENDIQTENFPFDQAVNFKFLGKRAEVFFKYYL